jgi:hypothetical protein
MNRQFYRTFPITNALRSQFSWTHYRTLIRIDNLDKREFYIVETEKNNWNARQLERQVNSVQKNAESWQLNLLMQGLSCILFNNNPFYHRQNTTNRYLKSQLSKLRH